jgi:hypothetical protein
MLDSIRALYSGKCQRSRHVYAKKAVYDDPPSFCALLKSQLLSISVRALVDIIQVIAGIKLRGSGVVSGVVSFLLYGMDLTHIWTDCFCAHMDRRLISG